MKLTRMWIKNFRCYKEEIQICFEDLTVLVGKNDSGKSTILDALEIFLNEADPDVNDASKDGDPRDLKITCEFDDLPNEVVIDETFPTRLKTEFLLNDCGRLKICKTYSGHLQKPKCTSVEAIAIHPTAVGISDLLQLKNADLKRRAEKLGVSLEDIDQTVNAQIRDKIRSECTDLQLESCPVPLNEDNAKKIWTGLRDFIPGYALFKSDRTSTDQDPEAQEPLKAAVKEALKSKESELKAIADFVENEVENMAGATLKKLREMDASLASQLRPNFSTQRWDTLFKASFTGDDEIPINKRGSGVRRLILLNFFRAKAEQIANDRKQSNVIYSIEEPETSQHPNNQRMLLRALTDLAVESQVILSTHTPMLARAVSDKSLRYINIKENNSREILSGNKQANELMANSLGVLPDNTVKLFIGVEGPNDITFLQNISSMLCDSGVNVCNLLQMELNGEVLFFPLGGSSLLLWSTRLELLNRPEFHLYDRDAKPPAPAKYDSQINDVNARENCKARSTVKREIENYLHKDSVIEAYKENGMELTINSNFDSFEDVPQVVAREVHRISDSPKSWEELAEKQKEKKISKAKKVLCYQATKCMTRDRLNEIDPKGDLLDWFRDISKLLAINRL